MNFSKILVDRFVQNPDQYEDPITRKEYGFLEAGVSIAGNTALSMIKFFIGFRLGSLALIADGIHTLSDIITSIVVLLGFRIAAVPPDREHPFGHGRAESIISLIISALLIIVGFEFFKSGLLRINDPVQIQGSLWITLILLAGSFGKEWMARFSFFLGKKVNSEALIADGWHHRSDAAASTIVALSILGAYYGYYYFDAVAAMVVSCFIFYTGYRIGSESFSQLLGKQVPKAELLNLSKEAATVPGVKGVHRVEVHDYGIGNRIGTMHVLVDKQFTVAEGHKIATQVERHLKASLAVQVTVHVEPFIDN